MAALKQNESRESRDESREPEKVESLEMRVQSRKNLALDSRLSTRWPPLVKMATSISLSLLRCRRGAGSLRLSQADRQLVSSLGRRRVAAVSSHRRPGGPLSRAWLRGRHS